MAISDKKNRYFGLAPALGALGLALGLAGVGCGDDDGGDGDSNAAAGRAGSSGSGGSGGTTAGSGGNATAGSGANGGGGGQSTAGAAGETGESGAGGQGGAAPVHCVPDDTVQPVVLPVSSKGHDGLFGAAFDDDGNLYATGYVDTGTAPAIDRATIVVKLDADGELDPDFGEGGVATINVVEGGTIEQGRGIVLQSDGKIVVAGASERQDYAANDLLLKGDTDVFLLRLDEKGGLDASFGEKGLRILDLNEGIEGTNNQGNPAVVGADQQWGLSVYGDDRLIVHGSQRGVGFKSDGTTPRTDSDWAVVRLTAGGDLDNTFATGGKFLLDIGQANASARTATILEDGSVVAAGYSTYGGTQRPVIFKLTPQGRLDTSFGSAGVFAEPVGTAAEAYAAASQSDGKFVTAGYGRPDASAMSTDFISIRLAPNGTLDNTYGTDGKTWFDVGGFGDNSRSMVVLPDDRPVLVGGGRVAETDLDGAVTILTPDGALDTSFAPEGCRTYDFGTGGDFLWGTALSPDGSVLGLVGITGVPQGSDENNDSVLVLLPIP